jgi:hypothetical protein
VKLEGSLDAFSLPDIFQLLSFTKKTGGLHLASDGSDGVVFFATGEVTGASADSSRQPLARRLVGGGAVSDEALSAAVAAVAEGEGLGVVRALLEAEAVDAELLRQAATDQAVDAIFDLLRWRTGDFAFVMDESNPDDVGVALATDSVLEDAEARNTTWETVSKVVPSPQAVPTMPVVLGTDPVVSREEWSLLALVDGRRSVGELVDLTGSGQYAVVSTLAGLVQRGLLEVRAGDATDGSGEDHVTVVVRRQSLLAGLEAFVPVVEAPAVPDARMDEVLSGGLAEAVGQLAPAVRQGESVANMQAGLVNAEADAHQPVMLGGAHVPEDVVPQRPEPFLPRRQADFDETVAPAVHGMSMHASGSGQFGGSPVGDVVGATATAPDRSSTIIERDPNVNRSLMLRLIAGVRGL